MLTRKEIKTEIGKCRAKLGPTTCPRHKLYVSLQQAVKTKDFISYAETRKQIENIERKTEGKNPTNSSNLLDSKELQNQLVAMDPSYKLQDGMCGWLAEELWETHPHVIALADVKVGNPETEGYEEAHVVAKLKDGTYVDSLGIWDKQGLEQHWRDKLGFAVVLEDFIPVYPKDSRPMQKDSVFNIINKVIEYQLNK